VNKRLTHWKQSATKYYNIIIFRRSNSHPLKYFTCPHALSGWKNTHTIKKALRETKNIPAGLVQSIVTDCLKSINFGSLGTTEIRNIAELAIH
jgi:hypothetical protein